MVSPVLRAFTGLVGLALAGLSLLGSVLSVHAIVDPAGAQMANDNDPFGMPRSFSQSLTTLAVCVALGLLGAVLIYLACRRRNVTI